MADKKISALTGASTPLAGTEVLPIVQSNATVKVAVDNLTVKNIRANATSGILQVTGPAAASTRVMTVPDANFTAARTDAANSFTGDQTLSTGNLIVSNGKGIDFTDTPGTGTSELLADYEEGTWTPVDQSGAGLTLTVVAANYTKVGRAVIATVRVTYPVNADATQARISPPFAISGATSFALASSSASALYGYAASTSMYFYLAAFGTVTNANLSGVEINISFSFTAA
jgi:hypothetical protein